MRRPHSGFILPAAPLTGQRPMRSSLRNLTLDVAFGDPSHRVRHVDAGWRAGEKTGALGFGDGGLVPGACGIAGVRWG